MPRSTRNLVRLQIQHCAEHIDAILVHLKNVTDMCKGRSTPVNVYMSSIVILLDEVKKALIRFRGEL